MDTMMQFKNPYNYFQSGTVLFNLKEFRKIYTNQQIMEFALSQNWQLPDHDILNCLAEDKAFYIDMAWNMMVNWIMMRMKEFIALAPKYLQDAYFLARENPFIIHYAGPDKPWKICNLILHLYGGDLQKKTPYYQVLLM